MEENGQTARPGAGLSHPRMLGWPSWEHIDVMITGVLGQPAELRRSQGGERAGQGANRGLTSLSDQAFACRDGKSCTWASLQSLLACRCYTFIAHGDRLCVSAARPPAHCPHPGPPREPVTGNAEPANTAGRFLRRRAGATGVRHGAFARRNCYPRELIEIEAVT